MENKQVRTIGAIRALPWLLGGTAITAATLHVLMALGSQGAMALAMAGMGLLCLTCLPHLRATSAAVQKSAMHLMAMSAAMAIVHMGWIVLPGMSCHGTEPAIATAAGNSHATAMLALIAVEILALFLASAVMRFNRSISLGTARALVH